MSSAGSDLPDAENRARQARAATIGSWTDHQKTWALIRLAGGWPDVFDAVRDQVEDSSEEERGNG